MPVSVQFRTLTQQNFTLELNEDQTIADVKTKVFEEKGSDYAADLQKLIYNGKILDDTAKVGDIGFEASKFVVVMLSKKKTASPAAEPTPSPAASAPVAEPSPAPAPAAEPAPAAVPPAAEALSAEQESTISAITGMGYDRELALAACRAAFWNADRAVEFLLNGIPEDIAEEVGLGLDAPAADNNDDEANEDLNMLANMPQLNEIRGMIQQNPEMLAAVLQQLATVNPRLVQTIQNNQQAFMDILNGQPSAGAQGQEGGAEPNAPRRHVIRLSPEEAAAIERIKAIVVNAPEALVVEAYFACEKNEEAAINFIFNSLDE
uniref:UV excision repair protein RAD23 n=1 Tax=Caenorhabditis japonica TaxID=281687 RepID=A0A8R1DLT4_CAEJA